MTRFGLGLLVCLGVGCTGDMKNVGDLDGGSTDGGSDDSSSASMSSTSNTTPGTATSTTDATTTTTDTATGTTTTATDTSVDCLPAGESLCAPAPTSVDARFVIDDEEFPFEDVSTNDVCDVTALTDSGPNGIPTIDLQCDDVLHTIEVTVPTEALDLLTVGMQVGFEYAVEVPFWSNRWFAIRDGGNQILIGGQDANAFEPPIVCIPEQPEQCNLYRPLTIDRDTEVCDTDPPQCDVQDACFQVRRQAILASDGTLESPIEIYDRGVGQVPGAATYEIRVAEAAGWENVVCTDIPSTWYRFVIARLP
jgi:hypothetical protein